MNQSVLKALDILNLFNEDRRRLTLRSISKTLDIPKPTAYRMLSAMEQRGYIQKHKVSEQSSYYTLGLKMLLLGQLVKDQLDIRQIARPIMQELALKISEDVHLMILDHHDAVYIEKAECQNPFRMHIQIGSRLSLQHRPGPMVLLAFQNDVFIRDYLESVMSDDSGAPFQVKIKVMKETLNTIREQGYHVQPFHSDRDSHDSVGIAYPIFNSDKNIAGVLSIYVPTMKVLGSNGEHLQKEIENAANSISRKLGFLPTSMSNDH